jgi:hypothetical protein
MLTVWFRATSRYPALRITSHGQEVIGRLTALSTQAFADRFDVATKPSIILADQ